MKKPGRNDPCSCGSGKKFKRCCGYKPAKPTTKLEKPKMVYDPRFPAVLLGVGAWGNTGRKVRP